MPCRTDYMEPTAAETEMALVIDLAKFVHFKLTKFQSPNDVVVMKYLASRCNIQFSDLDGWTNLLCSTLKTFGPSEIEHIIYDARDPMSRKLADWWEKHLAGESRRAAEDKQKKDDEKLREETLLSLTPDQIRVLGLSAGKRFFGL
jgi:hypothetical protein